MAESITRTVVILALAAPDQNRKVYAVHRATGACRKSIALAIGEQVASFTCTYSETIDVRALAALYATPEAPVWEKL